MPGDLRPEQYTAHEVTIGWLLAGVAAGRIPQPPFTIRKLKESAQFRLSFYQHDGTAPTTEMRHDQQAGRDAGSDGQVIGVYDNPIVIVPLSAPPLVGFGLAFVPDEGNAVTVVRPVTRKIEIRPFNGMYPPQGLLRPRRDPPQPREPAVVLIDLGRRERTPPFRAPAIPVVTWRMAVEIKLPTVLRAQADGQATVAVDGATVGEVFGSLVERYPGLRGNLLDDVGRPAQVRERLQGRRRHPLPRRPRHQARRRRRPLDPACGRRRRVSACRSTTTSSG